jgi:prevent-host-death family protein
MGIKVTVNVTEFKAKCLALLEEVGERGGTITVTKRGRPLATVRPARQPRWKSLEGAWKGKVSFPKAMVEPEATLDWDVVRESDKTEL